MNQRLDDVPCNGPVRVLLMQQQMATIRFGSSIFGERTGSSQAGSAQIITQFHQKCGIAYKISKAL